MPDPLFHLDTWIELEHVAIKEAETLPLAEQTQEGR